MGKLVQFEGRGKEPGAPRPDPSASAEILIFTGVRYERQDATPPKPSTSSGSKRKRG
ncbi:MULTISPECIES: hypothetical protein [unclassified Devosia]|uniref:hypothetical protein n=1 Tax=unclassified Devosia TaxID=196773 RepID=UPI000A43E3FE|nr:MULTISPECIES: hypothetical protein [unclassified Devosia]MBN9305624.1 hypothetical protein [Devosia sp.]